MLQILLLYVFQPIVGYLCNRRDFLLSLSKACYLSFLPFVMLLQPFPSMSVWPQNNAIKSCHIYKKDKNGCFILDFFGSDLSKIDQTWSNLIKPFGQKWIFGINGFSAQTAFLPILLLSNLKWLFDQGFFGEKWGFF